MSLLLRNIVKQLSFRPSLSASCAPVSHEIIKPKHKLLPSTEPIRKINTQVPDIRNNRLFAVVHISGKQFKVTPGDIIVLEGYCPPTSGDKLKLEKVMLVGSEEYSLIGAPLIQDGLVDICATVIEKTLSHSKTSFKKKRRKQYTNINFYRVQQTMLRINHITMNGNLASPLEVSKFPQIL